MRPENMLLTHVCLVQVEIFVCRSIFSLMILPTLLTQTLPLSLVWSYFTVLDNSFWSEKYPSCWRMAIWEMIQLFNKDLFSAYHISTPCKASGNQNVNKTALALQEFQWKEELTNLWVSTEIEMGTRSSSGWGWRCGNKEGVLLVGRRSFIKLRNIAALVWKVSKSWAYNQEQGGWGFSRKWAL